MIDPISIGLGGVGLLTGLLGQGAQSRQAKAQMMMRAAEQEAAPWTKQAPQTQAAFAPQTAVGAGLGGALSGFQMAQSMGQASKEDELRQALLEKLTSDPEALKQTAALKSLGLGSAQTLYGNRSGYTG